MIEPDSTPEAARIRVAGIVRVGDMVRKVAEQSDFPEALLVEMHLAFAQCQWAASKSISSKLVIKLIFYSQPPFRPSN